MRKILMTLLTLCAVVVAKAQIETSGHWYNGWLTYSASQQGGGKVLMNAMAEGEEHEFMLVPVAGKPNVYRVADGPNDYVNEYSDITTVRHQKKEGWNVLCFYNAKNELKAVLEYTDEWNSEKLNLAKWKSQLMGDYSDGDELQVRIYRDNFDINGELAAYTLQTFNGMITPYVHVNEIAGSTNRLEGSWEIVLTLEGLTLYSVAYDNENGMWVRKDAAPIVLKKNKRASRFFYASNTLLNDKQFRRFSKTVLRIMRNSILARNGYSFKSADLQEYFANEPWYTPVSNNKEVKTSFVEQLNIELIKAEESRSFEEY